MDHNGNQHQPRAERFTVDAHRPQSTARESYPQSVQDLTRTEVKMLTEILHLDNTASLISEHEPQIQLLLKGLPKHLRRHRPLSLGWIKPSSGLCDLHKCLNGDVVTDALSLVQREVTTHFRQFDAYPQLVQPIEEDILASLRALKGLWTKPTVDSPVALGALPYQINECAACILARIASNAEIIHNLRVVLQSRTRTRKSHRAPTLMGFVDECIRQVGGDDADELFGTASNLAYQMKATRKACVKAWYHDPNREPSDRMNRKRRHRKKKSGESSKSHREQRYTPPLTDIPEESTAMLSGHDAERKRRSRAPSPELCRANSLSPGISLSRDSKKPQRKVRDNAPSDYTWANLQAELGMVHSYQKLAHGNPYSRATPIPEAKVAPLRVSKAACEVRSSRERSVEVPLKYQFSASDYSSSDYWTDASCEESDCDAPARQASSAAITTWSLVCKEGNSF